MQVFNAKRSTLTIPLDNGELIQVKPGECSRPFVGTASILMSVINTGSPSEIGVIVSSSYELDLIRQVSASMEYLYQNENDARAKLLEGKDLTPTVSDNPYAVEMQKLQEKYDTKCKDYEFLEQEYKNLVNSKSNDEELTRLRTELSNANDELIQLRNTISELNAEKDALSFTITDQDRDINGYKEQVNTLSAQVAELQSKLDAELNKVELDPEQVAEKTLLVQGLRVQVQDLTDELARVAQESAEPLSAEDQAKLEEHPKLVAEISSLKAEINSMRGDATQIVEKYNKAKDTVVHLMDKFSISYVDGQYVQTTSPSKSDAE
jgi:predicted nuclease with TOPRIM domain